ncbi:hypothetical protein RchiOBHm_Chr4g0429141 [Rosa chinensis]|uniref:Uncharacterized protein n=1 Tax=Rosa chinensis TaxID=74649 RepID=A0A2P6R034_ROSCH|nr:hypothetical protein RchiOBHm_Chr4g0429141 [Rosa chinensis]
MFVVQLRVGLGELCSFPFYAQLRSPIRKPKLYRKRRLRLIGFLETTFLTFQDKVLHFHCFECLHMDLLPHTVYNC